MTMAREQAPSQFADDGKRTQGITLQLPENLTLGDDGLIYTPDGGVPMFICAPFRITRVTRNARKEGVAAHIEFVGDAGPCRMLIFRADAHRDGGSGIAWSLQNAGLRCSPEKFAHMQLARFFALARFNALAEYDDGC